MMRYPARRLLKVVSLMLGALMIGLLGAIVAGALLREDRPPPEVVLIFIPVLLLPTLYVLKLIRDSFSVLEVDEQGIRVRKWLGGTRLEWARIRSVRYWEQLQMVHGATSREYFAELRSPEGKRLLRLKSTYEPAAFVYLLEQARAHNLQVEVCTR